MSAPSWMGEAEVLGIHNQLLARYGGTPGVRSPRLLKDALAFPRTLYSENPEFELTLAKKFPRTYALAKEVHDRRYESMASHPLIKKTGKAIKRINYRFLSTARKLLRESVTELVSAGLT